MYHNIPQEDLQKYSLLLDKSFDEIKKEIHNTCKDYYLEYLFNEAQFEDTAKKLQQYLDLNIDAINDYINYCLLVVINTLLEKLYNVKGYDQQINPGLSIKRYHQRQAEKFIKELGLTPGEVSQTIEYTKQSVDLWILRDLTNIGINVKPKTPLPAKVRGKALANITYLGDGEEEIYNTAKMFYGQSIVLSNCTNNEFKDWFDNDYNKKS